MSTDSDQVQYLRDHPSAGSITHKVPPLRSHTQRVLERWQTCRAKAGWPPLVVDPWCQAAAEEKAYAMLIERYKELKDAAYARKWKAERPYMLDVTDHQVGAYGHSVSRKVTHVGLAVLPPECGGMAILIVGEKR